eukprot:scaffold63_cov306-Pinguiococcus_pyrenoidosus.AAC.8
MQDEPHAQLRCLQALLQRSQLLLEGAHSSQGSCRPPRSTVTRPPLVSLSTGRRARCALVSQEQSSCMAAPCCSEKQTRTPRHP